MKRIAWGVLFVLSMTCLSCSEIRQYGEILRDGRISGHYLDVLKTWTREKTVYDEFATMARIVATERSSEFRAAYRTEYDRIQLSSTEEKAVRKSVESCDSGGDLEFFFYAYVPNGKWNDFAQANSIWKVFLVVGCDEKVFPLELREIKEITPVTQAFFPYITPYGKFYSVRFPVPLPGKDGPPRILVFSSVLGQVELHWPGE